MTLSLRGIKNESRVLAIDACNSRRLIGVVYRGGMYLDGVLLFGERAKLAIWVGKDIRESKYFPELKILMLHDPSDTIDSESLQKETMLPLLAISTKKPKHDKSPQFLQFHQGKIWVKTLLHAATVRRILDLTWTAGPLPEPVRVAHLLGRSILFSSFNKVKDKSRLGSQVC